MRTRSWLPGVLCLLVLLAFGCDRSSQSSEPRSDGTVPESAQSGDREKSELVLAGQLRSVDPESEILVVAFEDDLYEFAYTDATEIAGGTANAQGLTGNTGSQITVHYRRNAITSTKTAVRIELQ